DPDRGFPLAAQVEHPRNSAHQIYLSSTSNARRPDGSTLALIPRRMPPRVLPHLPLHEEPHPAREHPLAEPDPPRHPTARRLRPVSEQTPHHIGRDLVRRLSPFEVEVNLPLVPQQVPVEVVTPDQPR